MQVKRIVSNFYAADPSEAKAFYEDILGMEVIMDHGWLRTYSPGTQMTTQVNMASEGGSGTPVPDLSIEVDDLDAALARVKEAGVAVEYGPVKEHWGVRRFYVRDPFGRLINLLQHE